MWHAYLPPPPSPFTPTTPSTPCSPHHYFSGWAIVVCPRTCLAAPTRTRTRTWTRTRTRTWTWSQSRWSKSLCESPHATWHQMMCKRSRRGRTSWQSPQPASGFICFPLIFIASNLAMTTNRSFLMDSHLLSRQRDTGTAELWDCETVGQKDPTERGHYITQWDKGHVQLALGFSLWFIHFSSSSVAINWKLKSTVQAPLESFPLTPLGRRIWSFPSSKEQRWQQEVSSISLYMGRFERLEIIWYMAIDVLRDIDKRDVLRCLQESKCLLGWILEEFAAYF